MTDPAVFERLADALQALAPLVQRLAATARQQREDADAALVATERAVGDLHAAAARAKGGA